LERWVQYPNNLQFLINMSIVLGARLSSFAVRARHVDVDNDVNITVRSTLKISKLRHSLHISLRVSYAGSVLWRNSTTL